VVSGGRVGVWLWGLVTRGRWVVGGGGWLLLALVGWPRGGVRTKPQSCFHAGWEGGNEDGCTTCLTRY